DLDKAHAGCHFLKAYVYAYTGSPNDQTEQRKALEKAIDEYGIAMRQLKQAKDPYRELSDFCRYRVEAIRRLVGLPSLSKQERVEWLKVADSDAELGIKSLPMDRARAYAVRGAVEEEMAVHGGQAEFYQHAVRSFKEAWST